MSRNLTITAAPFEQLIYQYTCISRNHGITAIPFEPFTTSKYMYVPQPYPYKCCFWVTYYIYIYIYIYMRVCPTTLPSQLFLLNPLLHQYASMYRNLTITAVPFESFATSISGSIAHDVPVNTRVPFDSLAIYVLVCFPTLPPQLCFLTDTLYIYI